MASTQDNAIVGARIRQQRRSKGIKQADLAAMVGISPSYLNLIEWNKRRIGGKLLNRIIDALDLSKEDISEAAETRLLNTLNELAELPGLSELDVEMEMAAEMIGRFPGWSRAIAALARAEHEATARAQTLSDRLSNDPFLSETLHRMLTRVAAIRSTTEILTEYSDIPTDQRDRFNAIVRDESRALSDIGEALANYLDKSEDQNRILTPVDEVEAFLDARNNHIAEIETASEPLASELTDHHPVSRRATATTLAENALSEVIDDVIAAASELNSDPARRRARQVLTDYATGAILMPMTVFAHQAASVGYDIEALAESFASDFDSVCHRLTALPPAPNQPRFGYIRANAAGTIIEMLGLRGLAIPRYASACPLWVLYRAQQSPETVIRQRTLFPSGARFVFIARARHWGPTGFGRPRHYLTDMIVCSEADSQFTVYAPDTAAVVDKVGPSCRLCSRTSCAHRVDDPLAG